MTTNTHSTAAQAVKGVAKHTSTGTTLQSISNPNGQYIISGEGCSAEKHFADVMLSGQQGMFAVEVTSDLDPGLLRQWNGQYWAPMSGPVIESEAAVWLDAFHPDEATPAKAASCARFLTMRLRKFNPLRSVDLDGVVVVPTPSGYIYVNPDGSIHCGDADSSLGLTHGVNIPLTNTQRMSNYEPTPPPADSKFAKMLAYALPNDEVRDFVQEQCALALMPDCMSHCAWWHGAPAASKSTLAEMIAAVSCQVARISFRNLKERFGLEPIVGASLIMVDECEGGKVEDESTFKRLVSGNGTCIDRKNEKAIPEYHSNAKWIVSCQDAPFFKDKSGAMERRVGAVPFHHSVPEHERVLNYHKVLLKEEGHIFLDWLLIGLRRVVQRGRILTNSERPEEIRSHQEAVRLNTDSILAWCLAEGVTYTPGSFHYDRKEVYDRYQAWCEGEARECLTDIVFWRRLRDGKYVEGWKGDTTQSKPADWNYRGSHTKQGRPRFVPFWFMVTGP